MHVDADVLVIGAGPYGLSAAGALQTAGFQVRVIGQQMGFWRRNMPARMFLRSGTDWHLDAAGTLTFERYLVERSIDPATVPPVPVHVFLDYCDWFCRRSNITVLNRQAEHVRQNSASFDITLADGAAVRARCVVCAPGIANFAFVPAWFKANVPAGRYSHTCERVTFEDLRGKRCLIVGGRQSAFEWAALLLENGAAAIDLVYRHETPEFVPSDWSFVDAHIDNTVRIPGWFRGLSSSERDEITRRFWTEGRLKLEPWLVARLASEAVVRHPRCDVVRSRLLADDSLELTLSDGSVVAADHIILATGYKPDVKKVEYLDGICEHLEIADGSPQLDDHFQTSVPGLFITGFLAVHDFGPFFGFVRACPASSLLIADGVRAALKASAPALSR
ncbi:MAG: NAD(P)-binding domain-containing protein [Candidatus Velthaea sp.]